MNDALREAASVDPEWAKLEGRRQFILKATVAGTLVALAIGTIAFVLGYHNAERITRVEHRVEHSACQEDPAGPACQQTKRDAARAANLYTTCIPFWKAGYSCPKPGSPEAEDRLTSGGDASQPAPTAGQQPKPGKQPGGEKHGGANPKGKPPKAQPAPAPQPSPAPEATPSPTSTPTAEESGGSGETPAAENGHGAKACVELVVSACVDAEP